MHLGQQLANIIFGAAVDALLDRRDRFLEPAWVDSAQRRPEYAWAGRRFDRVVGPEHVLVQPLSGPQADEVDRNFDRATPREPPGEGQHLYRRADVEPEDAGRIGERTRDYREPRSVTGPPRATWRRKSGRTLPEESSTFPSRTAT